MSAEPAEPADATLDSDAIPSVRDGVFFILPEALPRGRHSLSRDQVRQIQSERLLAATTELLAAYGYRGYGAGDIARRAGVSLAAFYDCYADKDACTFAGYDRFIDVLLGQMTRIDVRGLDRVGLVRRLLHGYLETLQSDLVVAHAFQVEIDALGPPARKRRRDSLALFARFIRTLIEQEGLAGSATTGLSPSTYIGVVYAARQLACDALDEHENPDLLALSGDLESWVSDVFRER